MVDDNNDEWDIAAGSKPQNSSYLDKYRRIYGTDLPISQRSLASGA
jgi:hypothetical protein